MIRTALLVVGADGDAVDAVQAALDRDRFIVIGSDVVPEGQAIVRARLRLLADGDGVDLVLTLGGIGLALRDRVPEATLEAIDRAVPGLAEAMRAATPDAARTRGLVGIRRATLIANLPAAPAVAAPMLRVLTPHLAPVLAAIAGSER